MSKLTIDSRVINALLDRFLNIVNDRTIRHRIGNKAQVDVFNVLGTPSYLPMKIEAKVLTTGSLVELIVGGLDTYTHDFSTAPTFLVPNTDITLETPDLDVLFENDEFDIRLNDCTLTMTEVRTLKLGNSSAQHPYIEVTPSRFEESNNMTIDRKNVTANIDLRMEVDFGSLSTDDSTVLLEVAGDIGDEIQRDPRLSDPEGECLVIDTSITDKVMYISKANDSVAGMFISLDVTYRKALKNSRNIQPTRNI